MSRKVSADRVAQKALIDTAKAAIKPPYVFLLFDETQTACLAAGVVTDSMKSQAQEAIRGIFGSDAVDLIADIHSARES